MMVKTVPLKQWEVGRELRKRIKNDLTKKGFKSRFPTGSSSGEIKIPIKNEKAK